LTDRLTFGGTAPAAIYKDRCQMENSFENPHTAVRLCVVRGKTRLHVQISELIQLQRALIA
jgi:hypothetical protein